MHACVCTAAACMHIYIYASYGCFLIVASVLQSFTSLLLYCTGKVLPLWHIGIYIFGSWNLSDTKTGFISLTCICFQGENGMNSDRNQLIEEWRKKGKDSIM